jgi:hypothetical protein
MFCTVIKKTKAGRSSSLIFYPLRITTVYPKRRSDVVAWYERCGVSGLLVLQIFARLLNGHAW